MTSTRPSLPLAPRALALLGALALSLPLAVGPAPAGAAGDTADDATQRARFQAAWEAQDPSDPLTRVTSALPGV